MLRLFLSLLTLCNYCLADIKANLDIDINKEIFDGMNKFNNNPNAYFEAYTASPKEAGINKDNIKQHIASNAYQNDIAKNIRNNFDKRPEYKFSESELTKSNKVITYSNDIVHGIANEYTDCKSVKNCSQVLDNTIKYCQTKLSHRNYKCERERLVDVVIPEKFSKKIIVSLVVTSTYGGTFRYSLLQQRLTSATETNVTTTQDTSIDNISCNNFRANLIEHGYASNTFTHRVGITVSIDGNCKDPGLDITITQGHPKNNKHKTRGIYAVIDISSQDNPVISDELIGECIELNKRVAIGICKTGKEVCVSGTDTKVINGVEVTRDCWRYKTVYSCGDNENKQDHCSDLISQNCVQVSSQCDEFKDGICISQNKGYQCPTTLCSADTNVICGDSKIECIDGNCVDVAKNNTSDFNDSISKIAIVDAAIKDKPEAFTEDSKFIFNGRAVSCRKTGYGFSDCCKDGGWGVDLGLAHCNSEEKDLGENKENKLVIYVGKNIHKTSEFEPDRVDKRYCVFSSKIARIIQEQGRLGQLGITFGTGKYPDCSGLSPNMLSRIDMDKINLSEIANEIGAQHPGYDNQVTGAKLADKIKKYYSQEVAIND